jgi:RNA-splicing ligase RtcB
MGDRAWLSDSATDLLDEHPDSYKDLGEVMAAQSELVDPVHELRTVINYKGL